MGIRVSQKWVTDKLGAPEPDEDEPILTMPAAAQNDAPENASDRAEDAVVATDPAEAASTGVRRPSQPSQTASSSRPSPTNRDAIDDAIDAALEDWRPMSTALVGPIEELVANASSLEEVRERLAGSIDAMSVDQVAQLLAQTGFASRLAGKAGTPLGDDA